MSISQASRSGRCLTIALLIALTGLDACGGGDGTHERDARTDSTTRSTAGTDAPTSTDGERVPVLVQTRIRGFAGTVLPGSVIGGSAFCPGGTVRHERGSPDVGYPAVNVFRCADGGLRVGFGPGPDQADDAVQTSAWMVLEGTGRFEGMTGDGQMVVRWRKTGASAGTETFMGLVVLP